jgi:hypothetical protein
MKDSVYDRLFAYRPREGRSDSENFLTEAFCFALRSSETAARRLVSDLVGADVTERMPIRVETQRTYTEGDAGLRARPDMRVTGQLASGESFLLLVENKWDSEASASQLLGYQKAGAGEADKVELALITPRPWDKALCNEIPGLLFRTWDVVYNLMLPLAKESPFVEQFETFLLNQGLGPHYPVSPAKLAAYGTASALKTDFMRLSTLLKAEDWSFLPPTFLRSVGTIRTNTQHRLGGWFDPFKNRPYLFAGFVLDPKISHGDDHFSSERGPDLLLGFDAKPKIRGLHLSERVERLRELGLYVVDQDVLATIDEWRKLVVCKPLADIIRGHASKKQQVDAIHAELKRWCEVLFAADGHLVNDFAETWPEVWKR